MDKVVVEREVVVRDGGDGGNGTGSNAVWAIALVLIIGIIVGALYYSGALKKLTSPQQKQQNIDVKVSAPAAAPAAPSR